MKLQPLIRNLRIFGILALCLGAGSVASIFTDSLFEHPVHDTVEIDVAADGEQSNQIDDG